ncbi:competence type IV pilus ATPase ComGA [Desertibacillus haloalkaliphilus]|uniref:competence type IV pilus ATPase ComGA n=1 Tax=Desertibacillus haloalkaliphilus TaxID=1328930 RepID=UPI001C255A04|nr:competence type IV pilus ATPase ComGA [Desertibacillus haloalkaliphilus]MBU8905748.1 GspE/PulE family protein [Desertibacillus haloalkaliphilus]
MLDIEQKSKSLLERAYVERASDIHIIPREKGATIHFRVDQAISFVETLSKKSSEKLISHFKFRAGMDIGERRLPQSGSLDFVSNGKLINLRISTLPTPYFESLAIRLLPQEETYSLHSLSLFPTSTRRLSSLTKRANGLILITGPTGSGKTTTLYSMLYEAKKHKNNNIITLEDPIEKKTDDFIQVEVNDKAGLTYLEGLRAILRHDPDIIMVGEIRDEYTAKIAVRAALTGHLVLSTVHTKDTIGAIYRLIELGIPIHDLKQTVIGIASQRLVELTCPYCGEACHSFCRKQRQRRRLAVYEILSETSLTSVFAYVEGDKQAPRFPRLSNRLEKGIALGYIAAGSYDQWIGDANET